MNKRGSTFTDIFIFMIMAVVLVFISGIFIYIGGITNETLKEELGGQELSNATNNTELIEATFGQVNVAYQSLYWISLFIIVGMIASIFVGSFMVTTRPIFFVPYIFVSIIAIVVSVGISNAYQLVTEQPDLAPIFANFIGSNFILSFLPLWVTVIAFTGGIIMFARMKQQEGGIVGGFQ